MFSGYFPKINTAALKANNDEDIFSFNRINKTVESSPEIGKGFGLKCRDIEKTLYITYLRCRK